MPRSYDEMVARNIANAKKQIAFDKKRQQRGRVASFGLAMMMAILLGGVVWADSLWGRGGNSAATGGGGSTADTCTGETCNLHDGGTYYDGGQDGQINALRFRSTIGGNGGDVAAFECALQTAASSPCFASTSHLMEIFSTPSYAEYASVSSTLPGALLSIRNPDGGQTGRNGASYDFCVYNAELPELCETSVGGIEVNMSAQGGVLTLHGNSGNAAADIVVPAQGGYLRFSSTPLSTTADPFIFWTRQTQTGGFHHSWYTGAGGTQIGGVDYKGGLSIGSASVTLNATKPSLTASGTGAAVTGTSGTSFIVNVGTGSPGSSLTLTFDTTATNGWNCAAYDETASPLTQTKASSDTTTTCVLTNYTVATGSTANWAASDKIHVIAAAY